MTAEEKAEKDGKVEMVSNLHSLIVAAKKLNDVPSVTPSNKTKAVTGSAEMMKSSKIDDAEILLPVQQLPQNGWKS